MYGVGGGREAQGGRLLGATKRLGGGVGGGREAQGGRLLAYGHPSLLHCVEG